MTNQEYMEAVKRSESINLQNIDPRLIHAAIGINTENGEFSDVVKKSLFYGRTLDKTNAIEELGDILWYINIACDVLDVTMEEVMERNINKLKVRYPKQFSQEAEQNRDLEKERKVLEEGVR